MSENVHFVLVGFDYERLVIPILQGQLDADRVVVLRSGEYDDKIGEELIARMVANIEDLATIMDLDVETDKVDNIYKYTEVYQESYQMLESELEQGNKVHINISSMPRTVAFAFATAANFLATEEPDRWDSVQTYYVPPEQYLVTEMISELREDRQFLENLLDGSGEVDAEQRLQEVSNILTTVKNKGITTGARKPETTGPQKYIVVPPTPVSGLREFEETLLSVLGQMGIAESVSELAEQIAEDLSAEFDESMRSKVQYNIGSLEEKGYIVRQKKGNRYETQLSTAGELWVATHSTDRDGYGSPSAAAD